MRNRTAVVGLVVSLAGARSVVARARSGVARAELVAEVSSGASLAGIVRAVAGGSSAGGVGDVGGFNWLTVGVAVVCLLFYFFILLLVYLGTFVVYRRKNKLYTGESAARGEAAEGVSILRPLKGIDTEMELCLSSAFEQNYPKFEIIFAVESPNDPAIKVAQRIMNRYPAVQSKLLIGSDWYGPNPKVNNLSKAYYQAAYDIVWVLDSNVWVSSGALARSVDVFHRDPKIKLVHHLPNCIALSSSYWGAQLDEMFMMTSHSKFYMAINTVAISACVTGKSNLYRRSDLDIAAATFAMGLASSPRSTPLYIEPNTGIREFSKYIAEDNMIAEALWALGGRTALSCDTAVQPIGYVPFEGYWSRRVRWLRVRRYMVLVATLLEPLTESIVCGLYGTFAISVLFLHRYFSPFWFLGHMVVWCITDYFHFHNQLEFKNMEPPVPYFASKFFDPSHYRQSSNSNQSDESLLHPALTSPEPISPLKSKKGASRRSLKSWLPVWILRETLALPIWVSAMCGSRIFWRNRPFKINSDLSAHEIRN